MVPAGHDRNAQLLLEPTAPTPDERVEIGQERDADQVRPEGPRALHERLVSVEPAQCRGPEEEIVVEAGVEEQVDLVPVVLEHRHQVAHAQRLDSPVVEQDTHADFPWADRGGSTGNDASAVDFPDYCTPELLLPAILTVVPDTSSLQEGEPRE